MPDWFNPTNVTALAAVVQAIFAVILVIVTIRYVHLTGDLAQEAQRQRQASQQQLKEMAHQREVMLRQADEMGQQIEEMQRQREVMARQLEEMQQQRMDGAMPVLHLFGLGDYGWRTLRVSIRNVGFGPALRLSFETSFPYLLYRPWLLQPTPGGSERVEMPPAIDLAVGQSIDLQLENTRGGFKEGSAETGILRAAYYDIFGRQIHAAATIKVSWESLERKDQESPPVENAPVEFSPQPFLPPGVQDRAAPG